MLVLAFKAVYIVLSVSKAVIKTASFDRVISCSVLTATTVSSELDPISSQPSSVQQANEAKEDGYIHMNPKETKPEPPDMVSGAQLGPP